MLAYHIIDNATVEEIREYRQIFEMGGGKDGVIKIEQLREFFNNLGANMTRADMNHVFTVLDKPVEEHISFEDFFILSKIKPQVQTKATKVNGVLAELGLYDKDDVITESNLCSFAKDLNCSSEVKQTTKDMLSFADKNNKGYCSFKEVESLFAKFTQNY